MFIELFLLFKQNSSLFDVQFCIQVNISKQIFTKTNKNKTK